jgi:hypothetical protein
MNGQTALWRVLAVLAVAGVVGLVAGPFIVHLARNFGPAVAGLYQRFLPWRHYLIEAMGSATVMSAFAFAIGFVLGWLFRSGRLLAGYILGFTLCEEIWRQAILRFFDAGTTESLEVALLAIAQAFVVSLFAAIAFDLGRRFHVGSRLRAEI